MLRDAAAPDQHAADRQQDEAGGVERGVERRKIGNGHVRVLFAIIRIQSSGR